MNLPILTTMLHYFAIIPIARKNLMEQYSNYILTIILSTTVSILWHINNEPYNLLFFINYVLALTWFLFDYSYSIKKYNFLFFIQIIGWNLIIFTLSIICSIIPYNYYVYAHSLWHILSAIKSYYVSKFIVNYYY